MRPLAGRLFLLAAAGLSLCGTTRADDSLGLPDFAAGPEIRAQLTPVHFTTLSSEISARIERIATRTGERFAAGDVLVEFDCAIQTAQLQETVAEENKNRKTLEVAERLAKLKSAGQLEVDSAEADVAKAAAQHAMAQAALDKCQIIAPYGGITVERRAQEFQYVTPGEPILAVVDDTDLEIELIAPSRWLAWLVPGYSFDIHIDELDRSYPAHVLRLGGQVDPVSQSIKVIGRIDGAAAGLLPGMSGSIRIVQPGTADVGN